MQSNKKISSAFKTKTVGYDSDYFPSHIADLIEGNGVDKRFHEYFRVDKITYKKGVSILDVVGNNRELHKIIIKEDE